MDPGIADWVDSQLTTSLPPIHGIAPDIETGLQRLRERKAAVKAGRLRQVWLLAGLATIFALTATLPPTRAYAERCLDACIAGGDRLGQFVLSRLRPDETRLPINHQERLEAPDFILSDADGDTIRLSAFRGQVVVLNFWATWCNPCRIEIPWFIEFQQKHSHQGFSVIGVSLDDEGWATVLPYLRQQGVNYPVVLGESELLQSYGGVEALPTTLILDRKGRVAAAHVGLVSKAVYEREILSVLAESE